MESLQQRRAIVLGPVAYLAAGVALGIDPSAGYWIAGQIVSIDREAGKITLQHAPIRTSPFHTATSTFRYVESRWLIGRRAGARVRFRVDRIDLALRMTALIYIPG